MKGGSRPVYKGRLVHGRDRADGGETREDKGDRLAERGQVLIRDCAAPLMMRMMITAKEWQCGLKREGQYGTKNLPCPLLSQQSSTQLPTMMFK